MKRGPVLSAPPARPAAIATYKVTVVNANEGLNRTLDCDEDQIAAGFVLTCVAFTTSDRTLETHAEEALD
jgi:ferredoxin